MPPDPPAGPVPDWDHWVFLTRAEAGQTGSWLARHDPAAWLARHTLPGPRFGQIGLFRDWEGPDTRGDNMRAWLLAIDFRNDDDTPLTLMSGRVQMLIQRYDAWAKHIDYRQVMDHARERREHRARIAYEEAVSGPAAERIVRYLQYKHNIKHQTFYGDKSDRKEASVGTADAG